MPQHLSGPSDIGTVRSWSFFGRADLSADVDLHRLEVDVLFGQSE
jgi:hypothetical protein